MIDLIISATVGAIAGSAIMRRIDLRKIEEGEASADRQCELFLRQLGDTCRAESAHARATDRGNTLQARIDRALECVTENSAHIGKKMAAILRGDR